ncbi:hypothetical protein B2G71_20830 [Novosphingobium sp. PC22D]|uniref:glycosyltransferase family 2 protein n=1 Tax=Novosphingobium sp. PC22D TaxID=1962403 RepID=UPI000BFB0992|nr:glycosyltransferase [Novosphingobium sp. PC22D]PEQ10753.1 hypothetical protein B2G71_20830 [Novosphingobium sp. PC22D]
MSPRVSVLMAVHDGEPFLHETLRSVAAQSLSDFEFVVVDDASSDATLAILAQAAATDPRLRIIQQDRNLGLTRALNLGLRAATAPYVARIDADDTFLPERLERQLCFLEDNRDHVAVACGHHLVDGSGQILATTREPLDDWQVRWLGGFNPPAPHPTYFFRRLRDDGTANLYDESFRTAQDFDFWSRLALQGRTAVLPEVLVRYRRHAGAITVTKRREQAANCRRTGEANLARRLPAALVEQLQPLLALFAYEAAADRTTIRAAVAGCDAMLAHDLAQAPSAFHRNWVRRTAAGLLADAVLSRGSGLRNPSATAAFLYHARGHLAPLMRAVAGNPGRARKVLRNIGRF